MITRTLISLLICLAAAGCGSKSVDDEGDSTPAGDKPKLTPLEELSEMACDDPRLEPYCEKLARLTTESSAKEIFDLFGESEPVLRIMGTGYESVHKLKNGATLRLLWFPADRRIPQTSARYCSPPKEDRCISFSDGIPIKLAEPAGKRATTVDYQKMAKATAWQWSDEETNPLYCLTQCDGYGFRLLSEKNDRWGLTITVLSDGREICTWKGHHHSVFHVLNDTLYYADFCPSGSGGSIIAVDLKTGKKLWTSPLEALGPLRHSAYMNLMNLYANDEVVTVFGNESLGRYVEFKSVATGETLGHKIFPKPAAKE